jgi:hypothetical protein
MNRAATTFFLPDARVMGLLAATSCEANLAGQLREGRARTRRTATSVSSRRIDRVTDCTPLPAVRLVGSCLRPVAMLVLSVV